MLHNNLEDILSEPQLKVLGFLAYTGYSMGEHTMSTFCQTFGMDELALRTILRDLCFGKILENNYILSRRNAIIMLMWLVEHKPEWIANYRSMDTRDCPATTNAEDLAFVTALVNHEPTCVRQEIVQESTAFLKAICPLISNELFKHEIAQMPFTAFCTFIQILIPWMLQNDIEASDYILEAWNKFENYKVQAEDEWGMTLLYVMLAKGAVVTDEAVVNTWQYSAIVGIRKLIEGSYSEARLLLQKALGVQQTGSYFNDYLCNYLYALTLMLDNSTDSRIMMYDIAQESSFGMKYSVLPLKILVTYQKDKNHRVDDVALRKFCELASASQLQGLMFMAFILCRVMKRNHGISSPRRMMPQMWIFRIECSIFNPPRADGTPSSSLISRVMPDLATSLPHISPFAKQLPHSPSPLPTASFSAQTSSYSGSSKSTHGQTAVLTPQSSPVTDDSQIVYVMRQDAKIYPFLKTGSANVSQSVFHEIPFLDYQNGRVGTRNVTNEDRQLWQLWRTTRCKFPLGHILPRLTNIGKLFTLISGKTSPAKAAFFTPYVEIEAKDDGFWVNSNIGRDDIRRAENIICKVSNGLILYAPISDSAMVPLLEILSSAKHALSSEEQLHRLCMRLRSAGVEVRGDSYAAGCTPLILQGTSMLTILVTEKKKGNKTTRCICLMANPMEGALCTQYAGEGVEFVPAVIGNNHYRIQRDMEGERKNKERLLDYLQDIGCYISPSGQREIFIDTDQLLKLTDYISTIDESYSLAWRSNRMNVKELRKDDIHLSVKQKENWLELEGDVAVSEECMVPIRDLFEAVLTQNSHYVQIDEHHFVTLQDRLRDEIKRIASTFHSSGQHLKSSQQAATLVAETLANLATDAGLEFLQANKARMEESLQLSVEVPTSLQAELRPYQYEGYQWMSRLAHWGAGACLADDMGLGKTLQSITFMLSRAAEGPSLIVVPASVVKNWENEIHRFAPSLKTYALNTIKDKDSIIESATGGDVLIVSYGLIVSLVPKMKERQWCVICLDEAHIIKNKSTKTSSAVMELQSAYRLALTGTPIQNNLSELWNIFQFTNPGILGPFEQFRKKFVYPIMNSQNLERQKLLKRIIAPFMMRRTKAEVARELPSKREETILVNLEETEMDAYEYLRIKAQNKTLEAQAEKAGKGNIDILSEITKLRLAACDIRLHNANWEGPSSKLSAFENLLKRIFETEENSKILIFSQFTSFLKMIEARLRSTERSFLYLDGATSIKQRAKLVELFQDGETEIFLISLQAGGVGLNLTAANHVILLDPWWNPAIEQQAIDRAYRIGQQRDVTIHHLISRNTIEEKIVRLQQSKNDMATALLTGQELGKGISYEEMKQLIV